MADALGIQPKERVTHEWSDELKVFAGANMGFVKTVEGTFGEFFRGIRQTMVLPHSGSLFLPSSHIQIQSCIPDSIETMSGADNAVPVSKRTFVMAIADAYRLGRELIDQEPNRSVQIRRRIDTRIPNPLLSAAAPIPVMKPSLGGLRTTVTKSAWGARTGTGGGGGGGGGGGNLAGVVGGRPPTPVAPVLAVGGNVSGSVGVSRTGTPAPVSVGHGVNGNGTGNGNGNGNGAGGGMRGVVGQVGVVGDDDWDRDE